MANAPEIVMVVEASEEYPRHSCGDFVELADGSLYMVKMEIFKSGGLRHAADDEAKSDIVSLVSRDGGKTWGINEPSSSVERRITQPTTRVSSDYPMAKSCSVMRCTIAWFIASLGIFPDSYAEAGMSARPSLIK